MFYCINNLPEDLINHKVLPFLHNSFEKIDYKSIFKIQDKDYILNPIKNSNIKKHKFIVNNDGYPLRKLIYRNCEYYAINFLISRIEKLNKKDRYYLVIEKVNYYFSCNCGNFDCRNSLCGVEFIDSVKYSFVYFKNKIELIILWCLIFNRYYDFSLYTNISIKLNNLIKN